MTNTSEFPKLPDSVWHFQPREFITVWRKCGWLSENELAQCIPRNCLSGATSWEIALQRARTNQLALNQYFRKYYIDSRQRILHALAQIYIETGMLSLMNESGMGHNKDYDAFYGRGYLHLTWSGNYKAYGNYKMLQNHTGNYSDNRITATSTHLIASGGERIKWFPRYDPCSISTQHHAGDSSGFFWITKHFRGRSNINRVADLPYSLTTVAFICWLINGGNTGYPNRIQYAKYIANVLFDDAWQTGIVNYQYPPLSPAENPTLCAHFPPVEVPLTQNGSLNYERQIP